MSKWVLILLSLMLLACGDGVGEGPMPADLPARTDTGQSDSDNDSDSNTDSYLDTDTNIVVCPEVIKPSCNMGDTYHLPELMLSADSLVPPARFINMASNVVLGLQEHGGLEGPVAIAWDFDESGSEDQALQYATFARLPTEVHGQLDPVNVVSANNMFFETLYRKIAVLKNQDGYFLYGIPDFAPGETLMVPVDGAQFETDAQLWGAVYLDNKTEEPFRELEKICLYGEGLHCYDGNEWATVYEPDENFIRDLGILDMGDERVILLVGDAGFIAFNKGLEWDLSLSGLTGEDLTSVTVHPNKLRFSVGGTNGTHINTSLHDSEPIVCELGGADVIALNYFIDYSHFNSLRSDGTLYAGALSPEHDGFMCSFPLETHNPITALPVGKNYFILTENSIAGGEMRFIAIE